MTCSDTGPDAMVPVTACIITFNEEANLRECLESVAFCDEIVVVDSHSQDRTREIAREFTERVIERDWPGHIEQKNFAIDQATHDWVLCVDADERVSVPMREAVKAALGADPVDSDGFTVRRLNRYLGRWIYHCGWYPDRKLRLFRRKRGRWGGTNPHDHVQVEGSVTDLEVDLHHHSYRDLAHHLRTVDSFTSIMAREKLKEGQGFVTPNLLLGPPWKFFKMYLLQRGFLDGWQGFVCCVMGAFYVFLKYAKLWELHHLHDVEAERKKSSYEGQRVLLHAEKPEEAP